MNLKFKIKNGVDRAVRNKVIYEICPIRFTQFGEWSKAQSGNGHLHYFVRVSKQGIPDFRFSTYGHKAFGYEEAQSFCQRIADGEIDLDELQAQYDAEDAAKEREAIREAVKRAKAFRDILANHGMGYSDFLKLESASQSLGALGHQFLLGYDRGEGWPDV